VFVSVSPAAYPRLGLVVPRHRQKVVRRNLLKRRLKEVGRTVVLPRLRAAERPLDVLIRARPEAYGAAYADLEQQLEELMQELCSRGS
jgi:ribonuclease P protein component